ncbi:hypothetical protein AB0E08_03720 [Streptomyces sp. NPDC048281]|uniref:hypothetical protein n=1 Tax=Streptomyces sp. NPDC048281 TaxID=3154715 RepID=UPI00342FA168
MNSNLQTAEVSADALSTLVEAVKQDPAPVVTAVRESVQRSQQDVNNCMMGGWTS